MLYQFVAGLPIYVSKQLVWCRVTELLEAIKRAKLLMSLEAVPPSLAAAMDQHTPFSDQIACLTEQIAALAAGPALGKKRSCMHGGPSVLARGWSGGGGGGGGNDLNPFQYCMLIHVFSLRHNA